MAMNIQKLNEKPKKIKGPEIVIEMLCGDGTWNDDAVCDCKSWEEVIKKQSLNITEEIKDVVYNSDGVRIFASADKTIWIFRER